MDKPMKEMLSENDFKIFSDAYRREYRRIQVALRHTREKIEHDEKVAKNWLEEINRLKAAALKHGFDITKEPSS